MIKKLLEFVERIKCKLNCCYQSQCSLNEKENKKINQYNIYGKRSSETEN